MKKQVHLQIIVILLIGLMLILSCHTHPHYSAWDGRDEHCSLCQILYAGFTGNFCFELILGFFLIGTIIPCRAGTVKIFPQTGYDDRAPPAALLFN
jgi:hypothetical protein